MKHSYTGATHQNLRLHLNVYVLPQMVCVDVKMQMKLTPSVDLHIEFEYCPLYYKALKMTSLKMQGKLQFPFHF